MIPYSVTLPDGTTVAVVEKTTGRKRSINLLLFKIRRPRTLISYSVTTPESGRDCKIYKTKSTGAWNSSSFFGDQLRTRQIKKAIDEHEGKLGSQAYKELF